MTNIRIHIIKGIRYVGNSQTMFAPTMQNGDEDVFFTYGINGSIRKRVDHPTQNTDYYYFNASGNLKACGTDMQISVYGYNSANTRTYKVNLFNANQWMNGQPQPIQPMVQSAMFYPNTYINFNQGGDYTKHYYNGTERICSRLGEQQIPISVDSDQELEAYQHDIIQILYNAIGQHLYDDPTDMQEGDLIPLEFLQVTGDNNAIFYYHPNHLASTMYVTDAQQSVVQSFLYAPYGDIISEYHPGFNGNVLPNYAFNAKELDEETGMYYYEARYYKPPVFTSRDPMFEKYFWMTPYAYCANNPVKYVDPDGREIRIYYKEKKGIARLFEKSKSIVYTPGMEYNGENSFVNNAVKSLNYVYNNHADVNGIISKSAETTTVVKIKKGNIDYFKHKNNTISWSMKGMMVSDNSSGEEIEGRQSGALGLFHELGHFFQKNFHYEQYMKDINTYDKQYGDMEERRNIEQNETPAANILGEDTRNNHDGFLFKTVDPISTKTKKEVKQEIRQQP